MDDTAEYILTATVKDSNGQSASESLNFIVNWRHQAYQPSAELEVNTEHNVVFITPIAGNDYLEGDTCDIYRLSVDKPELVFRGAKFGTKYVDPYPTLGDFGGHRLVTITKNGDYITNENSENGKSIAWLNLDADDGDILDVFGILVDFDNHSVLLPYNVSLSNSWKKDFKETKYLGGSVKGDWNRSIERSATFNTVTIVEEDPDTIESLRRLAVFPGICHVRTPDGSSFAANIDVKEDREEKWTRRIAKFSLTVTRVDSDNINGDGMTYEDWLHQLPPEEEGE